MLDHDGNFTRYQQQLDAAGIDFDITNLAGATSREITQFVHLLMQRKAVNHATT